jgi:hypothetical protein
MGWIWHVSPTAPYQHSNAIRGAPADRLALGAGRLWAYGANGFWATYLASTGKLVRYQIPNVAGVYNQPGLTVGYGATWVVAPSGTLFEYTTSGYQRSVPIPTGAYEVAAGNNWLWVLGSDGTVTKINPYTLAHAHTYHLRHDGEGITFYKGRVWVSVGAATPR